METSAWCRLILAIVAAILSTTLAAVQYPLRLADDGLHFLIPARIGTPPQNLSLIVDTSTSDLVLFTDSATCGSHCFNATRSSSIRSSQVFGLDTSRAAFGLDIDGASVNSSDTVTVSGDIVRVGDDLQATLAFLDVDRLNIWRGPVPDTFQKFQNVDGLIGLAYSTLQRVDCINPHDGACTQFRRLAGLDEGQQRGMFTLDLGEQVPMLGIGNISDVYEPILQWGTANPYVNPIVHRFTVLDLTLCGNNLFANYSGQWEAIVDTGASCLSLPAEFFDMVMAWIPSIQYDSEPMPCWIPANATATLPKLSFQLDPQGNQLLLPLNQLLLPMNNGSSRLCIYRDQSIANTMPSPPAISFGALAMRAFYAAFDLDAVRVGLSNRMSLNTSTKEICSATVKCRGQQSRWVPMNKCLDPDCTGYLVRHFDPATKTCVLFIESEIIVYVLVGTLLVAELALHAFYWTQCRKIIASVPSY